MFRSSNLNLGKLETSILDLLWQQGGMTPKAVHDALRDKKARSVNTIASALKRLTDKGILAREKHSHAYVYQAVISRAELQRQLLDEMAQGLGQDAEATFLSAFVDFAEARGEATLARLKTILAKRLSDDEAP